jgi:hypothetical protein
MNKIIKGINGVEYPLITFMDIKNNNYLNVTEFCNKVGFDKHALLRLYFVKQLKNKEYKGEQLIITSKGNGGKALFHKLLIPSILSTIDSNLLVQFNKYILDNLDNFK